MAVETIDYLKKEWGNNCLILTELKKLVVICGILILSFSGKSQLLDSLNYFLHTNYSIDARLSSKLSIIDHQLTKVSGFRMGVVFKRKLRLGGGVDWLKTDFSKSINILGIEPITKDFVNESNEIVKKYYKLIYLCFYADFVFHKTKHCQYPKYFYSFEIQNEISIHWVYGSSKSPVYLAQSND